MFKEIENGAAEITWQISLLLLLCFIAFKKNVKIMYLFMYLQGREICAFSCVYENCVV